MCLYLSLSLSLSLWRQIVSCDAFGILPHVVLCVACGAAQLPRLLMLSVGGQRKRDCDTSRLARYDQAQGRMRGYVRLCYQSADARQVQAGSSNLSRRPGLASMSHSDSTPVSPMHTTTSRASVGNLQGAAAVVSQTCCLGF